MTCAVEVTRKLITPKPYKLSFLSISSPFKTNQQNQPSCHSLEESSLRSGAASVLTGLEFISLSVRNLRKDPSQSNCTVHAANITLWICFQIFRITAYTRQAWFLLNRLGFLSFGSILLKNTPTKP